MQCQGWNHIFFKKSSFLVAQAVEIACLELIKIKVSILEYLLHVIGDLIQQ